MKKSHKFIFIVILVGSIAYHFRYAILAESLIWSDQCGGTVASSTKSEYLLYALMKRATKIDTQNQYQLMDQCYVSLITIYKIKNSVELSCEQERLLERAFNCSLALRFSSEAEMTRARQEHNELTQKIRKQSQ